METIQSPTDASAKTNDSAARIVLGLLFLLPALLCCLFQMLIPTAGTFLMSLQKVNVLGPANTYVGMKNYASLFENEIFGRAAGFTFSMLLVRLLVIALVPVLLAWAAAHFGRPFRLGLRVLFSLPVALLAPVAIAITWLMFLNPTNGFFQFEKSWAASPASARSTFLFIDALYLCGLAGGLGLVFFLPLWRRSAGPPQPGFGEIRKPLLAAWALGLLGVSALTMSAFTLSRVLTNGGPVGSTTTLGTLIYQQGFIRFQMGPAAAVASLTLLMTMLLGIAAGLLVILSRLRLDLVEPKQASESISPKGSQALAVILVLLALGICLLGVLPFGWLVPQALGGEGLGRLLKEIPAARLLINSSVPPLVTATLQILTAYLAALGIGALRPFGKRSEWLLLLFSPWLFISVLPLSLVDFMASRTAHLLDTLVGSIYPIQLSIPALFVLTIFFAGRASSLQKEGTADEASFFKQYILPSLPLAALLWLVLAFFNGQDLLWPFLVSNSPESYNLNVALLQVLGKFGGANNILAAAITFFVLPVCLLFFVCLALFQIFYLDRLVLYREEPAAGI